MGILKYIFSVLFLCCSVHVAMGACNDIDGCGGMFVHQSKSSADSLNLSWDDSLRSSWGKDYQEVNIPSSLDGTIQKAIVHRSSRKHQPLVVSFHTWSGDYTQKDPFIAPEAVKHDWNFIHPDFRGSNNRYEAMGSSFVLQDIEDAVRYAVKELDADPAEVHVVGVSGGGYATLLAYMNLNIKVKSFSAWVPVSDIESWYYETQGAGRKYAQHIMKAIPKGESIDVDEARLRSPLWQAFPISRRRNSALHIYAGVHDGYTGSVPITHSLLMYNRLVGELKYGTPNLGVILKKAESDKDLICQTEMLELVTKQQNPHTDKSLKLLGRQIHLERHYANISITVFEGGHEQLPGAFFLMK